MGTCLKPCFSANRFAPFEARIHADDDVSTFSAIKIGFAKPSVEKNIYLVLHLHPLAQFLVGVIFQYDRILLFQTHHYFLYFY